MGQAGSAIPRADSATAPLGGEVASVTFPAPVLAAAALQGAASAHAAVAQGIINATSAVGADQATRQRKAPGRVLGGCTFGNVVTVPNTLCVSELLVGKGPLVSNNACFSTMRVLRCVGCRRYARAAHSYWP